MKSLKESQKETRQALSDRIKAAQNRQTLLEIEKKIDLHYKNGTISESQLAQLDGMIMRRLAKYEDWG